MPVKERAAVPGGLERSRSKDRYRRALLGAGANVLAKAVQGALALVSVPLALGAFGAERYGLWLTVSALLPMLGLIDQGLSFGLVQGLAEHSGRDDREAARTQVATYLYSAAGVALACIFLVAVSDVAVPWAAVLGAPGALDAEARLTMTACGLMFAANLVAGLAQKVHAAYQEQVWNSAWQVLGSGLSLAGLLLVVHAGAGVPWLAVALMGGPVLASFVTWASLFRSRPWLKPRLASFDWEVARSGLRAAGTVVTTGVLHSALTATDNFIISHAFSTAEVTAFAVPSRLYNVILSLVAMLPLALWPAAREALARDEYGWVRQSMRRVLMVTGVATGLGAGAMVGLGGEIVAWWSRGAVRPTHALLVGLSAWLVVAAAAAVVQAYLGALGHLRWQLGIAATLAVVVTALKIIVVPRLGPWMAPSLTAGGLLLFLVLPGIAKAERDLALRVANATRVE